MSKQKANKKIDPNADLCARAEAAGYEYISY